MATQADIEHEYEKAIEAVLADADIERAQMLSGVYIANKNREHWTQATPDAIRNFARGYGDDNPLFHDDDYGATTRWGGQIAPPMMLTALQAPLLGDPLPADLKAKTKGLFKGVHVFVSGGAWEWYRPVRPGDRIYQFGGNEAWEPKESDFAGRSVIERRRFVRMNDRGEVVALHRQVAVRTARKAAKDRGKYEETEVASYSDEDLAKIDAVYAAEQRRGRRPRHWEDVNVGDPLPGMVKGPLTVTELIVFHAGGYGFTPFWPTASRLAHKNRHRIPGFYVKNRLGIPDVIQRVHWDPEWARNVGAIYAYDYGVLRECWFQHYLTDWAGDDGWVFRQDSTMRVFNFVGDTQFLSGEVTGKKIEDGHHLVEIEFRMTSQRGKVTSYGTAAVLLPSLHDGPVVLPRAPFDLERQAAVMMKRHGELLAGKG